MIFLSDNNDIENSLNHHKVHWRNSHCVLIRRYNNVRNINPKGGPKGGQIGLVPPPLKIFTSQHPFLTQITSSKQDINEENISYIRLL